MAAEATAAQGGQGEYEAGAVVTAFGEEQEPVAHAAVNDAAVAEHYHHQQEYGVKRGFRGGRGGLTDLHSQLMMERRPSERQGALAGHG